MFSENAQTWGASGREFESHHSDKRRFLPEPLFFILSPPESPFKSPRVIETLSVIETLRVFKTLRVFFLKKHKYLSKLHNYFSKLHKCFSE